MKTNIISISTLTLALKAKKILAREGIRVTVVKVDSGEKGCTYGIEFNEQSFYDVVSILRNSGIEYTYHKKDKNT